VNHLGGETQQNSPNHPLGYSKNAQNTGNTPSYLELISNSMQKPIEDLSRTTLSELYKLFIRGL
jgi:hypothetical protein